MHKKNPTNKFFIFIIIGILFVVLSLMGLFSFTKNIFNQIILKSKNVTKIGNNLSNLWDNLINIENLANQNTELKNQNLELQQQINKNQNLEYENTILREQLRLNSKYNYKLISAETSLYQPDSFRSFLTIAKGSQSGIKSGMAAISYGVLVGKVTSTTSNTAKIQLVTDADFRINAIDLNTRASGTLSGQIGLGLIMDKIPKTSTLRINDTIATGGLGGSVPKGIVIGKVESIDNSNNGVFQTAKILSSVDLENLEIISIIVEPNL